MNAHSRLARFFSGSIFLMLLVAAVAMSTAGVACAADHLFARLTTEKGEILLVFYPELAPHHVDNFVHLARTGFYDGTKFHRIVPGFVIQGGDPLSKDEDPRNDGRGGPTLRDILDDQEWQAVEKVNELLASKGYTGLQGQAELKAEFSQQAKHTRGTLSMARGPSPDSAGSQFFICVGDTPQLDGQYTIFGHVVLGMDVADTIVSAETNPAAGRQAPAIPIAITSVEIIEGVAGLNPNEAEAWQNMDPSLKTAP